MSRGPSPRDRLSEFRIAEGGPMAAKHLVPRCMLLVSMLLTVGCSAKKEAEEQPAAEAAPLAQGERAIKRETWAAEPFTLQDSTEVQVTASIKSGPAVDLYVMTEADYNKW